MFFFLMLRRPPRSTRTDTLFPYTTLFRSLAEPMLKTLAWGELGPVSLSTIEHSHSMPARVVPLKNGAFVLVGFHRDEVKSEYDDEWYGCVHPVRSEERMVGKDGVRTGSDRW